MGGRIVVGRPSIEIGDEVARWRAPVSGPSGIPQELWFATSAEHASLLSDRADAALVGLVPVAMLCGMPLEVRGTSTDELVHAVGHGYQRILELTALSVSPVEVVAEEVAPALARSPAVATGFSGGVDSWFTVLEHHLAPLPEAARLSHLAFFNVGSHGFGRQARRLFEGRYRAIAAEAEGLGLPLVRMDSNLEDFYPPGMHLATSTPRTVAGVHVLAGGLGRYLLANGVEYSEVTAQFRGANGPSDPIALPLLSTAGLTIQSQGSHATRLEKLRRICDEPRVQRSLNVCIDRSGSGRNCSRCHKCLRTQFALELLGRLDDFAAVFDEAEYRRGRDAFAAKVLVSEAHILRDLRAALEAADEPPRIASVRPQLDVRRLSQRASNRLVTLIARRRSWTSRFVP
jgi:hypothetical protein